MNPAARPMIRADMGPTKPAAGVMPTRRATAPEAAPRVVGFPRKTHSVPIQERTAALVARWVAVNAEDAREPAARALPALNPNQPNHKSPAPRTVMGRLWGMKASPFPTPP